MSENKTLAARLKSREKVVPVKGRHFTIRRPKPAEMVTDMTRLDLVRRFVVGWDLLNLDLVPGGLPDPEPFDPDLFADYVEDDSDLWLPLSDAIRAAWLEYLAERERVEKN